MKLLVVGCNFHTAPLEMRERLAFTPEQLVQALDTLNERFACEAVILSTCNRVELYAAQTVPLSPLEPADLMQFLAEFHGLRIEELRAHLYEHRQEAAVGHLFRVASSLDSLIVGEAQIAGQVKRAYELAQVRGCVGPLLHALFQHARLVAKRVRSETGIALGHVSVSSAAVDYVQQVFDDLCEKTILVLGAGKMGELTLRHLCRQRPRQILVANRSPEKAAALAENCGGVPCAWERLDEALVLADVILSTTGASEPVVTRERWEQVQARRMGGTVVILDIAVPRDFDPSIHDGDRTCLFNIDDLKRIRDRTLQDRLRHVPPAEAIVVQERDRFLRDWARRRHGPVIARLTQDLDVKRQAILKQLFARLNGRLTPAEREYVEGAFRLLQNQFLHGPITALTQEPLERGHHLLEALRKLFRLHD